MMPALRGLLNSSSEVFFTVPSAVPMKMKWSAGKARNSPVSGSTTVIFSPVCSGNMLTIGLPRLARPPCGTSQTLSQ